jgi:hypothetical protein
MLKVHTPASASFYYEVSCEDLGEFNNKALSALSG